MPNKGAATPTVVGATHQSGSAGPKLRARKRGASDRATKSPCPFRRPLEASAEGAFSARTAIRTIGQLLFDHATARFIKSYAVTIPLGETYMTVRRPVILRAVRLYRPSGAVLRQRAAKLYCADCSLAGTRGAVADVFLLDTELRQRVPCAHGHESHSHSIPLEVGWISEPPRSRKSPGGAARDRAHAAF